MAGAVPVLYRFDRWDERIGMLRVTGELVHTEELAVDRVGVPRTAVELGVTAFTAWFMRQRPREAT